MDATEIGEDNCTEYLYVKKLGRVVYHCGKCHVQLAEQAQVCDIVIDSGQARVGG